MSGNKKLRIDREVIFSENPPYPKNMLVSLNNICNHRCVFCCNRKLNTNSPNIIEIELLISIMQQAYDLGTREIGLYTTAEPFTSKILEDTVYKAREIGFEYIYLTTNGALAVPKRVESVIKNGLHSIKFSINASDRETYKRVHGKDDFDKVIENIKSTDMLRKKINPNIGIFVSFVECAYSKGQADTLRESLLPYIDEFYSYKAENIGGVMYEELNSGILQESSVKTPCSMVFNRFHITPEGYLTACCTDFYNDMVVADLRDTPLNEAWNSDLFVNIRKQHLYGEMYKGLLCYNCIHNTNERVTPIYDL